MSEVANVDSRRIRTYTEEASRPAGFGLVELRGVEPLTS